mmetsp:Transcript_20249/g.26750  ORF Transcript_20249/g.26750 Transcript_20249/m.26750 type:complete len:184 (+) Transcript_20249:247-798(+)|eukprot:CAMPEP_0117740300 /NCGR_PEP_ID=MMETSP0947-20121206/4263_1 /TAXON_ID=44440 /ORGANISM="Chattonella subsalsa, Strain CCMP2191" /LENGTH=183 /DNA_ID=CAMNT_0005556395 /DNA_START=163 /DNA_END=714 /DNA_ORIENTATION=-
MNILNRNCFKNLSGIKFRYQSFSSSPFILFTTSHEVFQVVDKDQSVKPTIRIGISEFQLNNLGSINKISPLVEVGRVVDPSKPVCELEWDGFQISAADELYHTIWENASGTWTVSSFPLPTRLLRYNPEFLEKPSKLEESDGLNWLVELEPLGKLKTEDVKNFCNKDIHWNVMGEAKYLEFIE